MAREDEDRLIDNDASEETTSESSNTTFLQRFSKCGNIFSFLTVEPIILLLTFSFGLQAIIGQVKNRDQTFLKINI
jgi:hypothetical protein